MISKQVLTAIEEEEIQTWTLCKNYIYQLVQRQKLMISVDSFEYPGTRFLQLVYSQQLGQDIIIKTKENKHMSCQELLKHQQQLNQLKGDVHDSYLSNSLTLLHQHSQDSPANLPAIYLRDLSFQNWDILEQKGQQSPARSGRKRKLSASKMGMQVEDERKQTCKKVSGDYQDKKASFPDQAMLGPNISQSRAEDQRCKPKEKTKKIKKKPFPTKNFLQTFRPIFLSCLEENYPDTREFEEIGIIRRINTKNKEKKGINIQDFEDLLNQPRFESILEQYFREGRIKEDLMYSRVSRQNKMQYQKYLGVFEHAFWGRRFERINLNSKRSWKKVQSQI